MISIVVPVYNVEKYLNTCIESVLKVETDLEILLVDDGSTDGSGALCDAWAQKDGRIQVVHQENGGLSAARNTGIRQAKGSHVLFLDSDDFLNPVETDRMLAQVTEGTDVLMGLYNRYYTDDERYEMESCEAFLDMQGVVSIDDFLAAVPANGKSCYMTAWRFVIARDFLLEHGLFFLPGIYHEDEEWTQRLMCHTKQVLVTDCLFYQYRQARAGAITSTVKPKHLYDIFTILERSLGLIRQHPHAEPYLRRRMASLYLNNMIHLFGLQGTQRAAALEQLRRFYPECGAYMTGKIGAAARICIKITGIKATCGLLHVARRIVK